MRSASSPARGRIGRAATKSSLFVLCCLANVYVLRALLPGDLIAEGQFRRGYFESFEGQIGLAFDTGVRPEMLPTFLLTANGSLGVPPGMTAVLPLPPDTTYALTSDTGLAPYIVLGREAPLTGGPREGEPAPGDGRLAAPRELSFAAGRLALVDWDATRPWSADAARLEALGTACAPGADAVLEVANHGGQLTVRYGHCTLDEPLAFSDGELLLAAVAGPDWMSIARRPPWEVDRRPVWGILVPIVAQVATTWWALGPLSAAALSGVLAAAATRLPQAAALTWPFALLLGLLAAAIRLTVLVLRRLPRRARLPVTLAIVGLAGYGIASAMLQPRSFPPILRLHGDGRAPDACAVIGYSTVKGEGLRRQQGGIRAVLDDHCTPCRGRTAGLFAGGETLAWARDAYCSSPSGFGEHGLLTFLGGANDDYITGVLPMARLFLFGPQGSQAWRDNAAAAARASAARMPDQAAAIAGLVACARERDARVLFLHDFLSTDLAHGRDPQRAAMLDERRRAVEAAGETFVDLLEVFRDEAGVAWFNDYVHLSLIGHARVAEIACRAADAAVRIRSDVPEAGSTRSTSPAPPANVPGPVGPTAAPAAADPRS